MKKPTLTRRSFFGSLTAAIAGVAVAGTISINAPKRLDIHDLFDNGFQNMRGATLADHLALIEQIKASGILTGNLNNRQIDNISRYFISTPDRAAMKLWSAFSGASVSNSIALHQNRIDGTSPSRVLADIVSNKARLAAAMNNC
jgi:hypothetical protein